MIAFETVLGKIGKAQYYCSVYCTNTFGLRLQEQTAEIHDFLEINSNAGKSGPKCTVQERFSIT